MQEFMEIYKNNTSDIEKFLVETIHNLGNLNSRSKDNYKKLFKVFTSLSLLYVCDKDTLVQTSDNIYRNKTSNLAKGRCRDYLLDKVNFNEDEEILVTKPYISSATGDTCITLIKREGENIYFLDFDLIIILQKLGLIEIHKEFNIINKSFYFTAGTVMMIIAIFTIGYALVDFTNSLFFKDHLSIESIFKPIIAVTLSLAIFDLAKTLLEQEVIFKSYSKNSKAEYKVLTKFSITIIIALLIESLMVVFKIALEDYTKMISALYLIGGVSILLVALGLFIKFSKK